MNDRKIYRIFTKLQAKKKRKFTNWLSLELDGKYPLILQLAKALEHNKLEDNLVWADIFPTLAYNDGRFRRLVHKLMIYLEEFLAIEEFRKDSFYKELLWIKALDVLKSPEKSKGNSSSKDTTETIVPLFVLKEIKKSKNRLLKLGLKDSIDHWVMYELEIAYLNNLLQQANPQNSGEYFDKAEQILDLFFIQEKLRLAIAKRMNVKQNEVPSDHLPIHEIVDIAKSNPAFRENNIIQLYLGFWEAHNQPEEISSLSQRLKASKDNIRETELSNLYNLLINKVVRHFSANGDEKYLYELSKLYEWGIQDKILFEEGYLPWNHLRNYVSVALRVNKNNPEQYENVRNDLEIFLQFLPPNRKLREEARRFNMGQYHYVKGEFEQAIKLLRESFSHYAYESSARMMYLEAAYENNEDPEFIKSILESFIRYIERYEKLNPNIKIAFLNRLKLFRKLLKAFRPSDYEQLRAEIQLTKPLNNPQWLLEKVGAALGRRE